MLPATRPRPQSHLRGLRGDRKLTCPCHAPRRMGPQGHVDCLFESEQSAYSAKVPHGCKPLRLLEPLTLNQNDNRRDGGGAYVVRLPFSDAFFLPFSIDISSFFPFMCERMCGGAPTISCGVSYKVSCVEILALWLASISASSSFRFFFDPSPLSFRILCLSRLDVFLLVRACVCLSILSSACILPFPSPPPPPRILHLICSPICCPASLLTRRV